MKNIKEIGRNVIFGEDIGSRWGCGGSGRRNIIMDCGGVEPRASAN
jgi:hypothetical protein